MTGFCIYCLKKNEVEIVEKVENIKLRWSDTPITCSQKHAYCAVCGNEISIPEISDENLKELWKCFEQQQSKKSF